MAKAEEWSVTRDQVATMFERIGTMARESESAVAFSKGLLALGLPPQFVAAIAGAA